MGADRRWSAVMMTALVDGMGTLPAAASIIGLTEEQR
jgi:hypothetical protein